MALGVNSLKMISNLWRRSLCFHGAISPSSLMKKVVGIRTASLGKSLTLRYELIELYKPTITRYKDKLIESIKEKAKITTQSDVTRKLHQFKGYYTLEMAPPTSPQELAKLKADIALAAEFIKGGCYKYLTVRQAWLLFLVAVEVGLWFYLGETIGKMHIVGYKV